MKRKYDYWWNHYYRYFQRLTGVKTLPYGGNRVISLKSGWKSQPLCLLCWALFFSTELYVNVCPVEVSIFGFSISKKNHIFNKEPIRIIFTIYFFFKPMCIFRIIVYQSSANQIADFWIATENNKFRWGIRYQKNLTARFLSK